MTTQEFNQDRLERLMSKKIRTNDFKLWLRVLKVHCPEIKRVEVANMLDDVKKSKSLRFTPLTK